MCALFYLNHFFPPRLDPRRHRFGRQRRPLRRPPGALRRGVCPPAHRADHPRPDGLRTADRLQVRQPGQPRRPRPSSHHQGRPAGRAFL